MGVWAKSLQIFNCLCDNGKQSVRWIAQQTGFSKSSVHRLQQARERRETHPESWWWETEDGRGWLIRLVVATLYTFGFTRGVGAETISKFFGRLHLETQVGCSPSALRGVLYLVSDRAKALIKLAEKGLECVSIPDVFHLIHDLVKSYSLAICGPLRQARQALHQARESLTTCQASQRSSEEAQQAQAEVEACEAEVERWESVHSAYRHHLETVSLVVHPWRIFNSTPQTSQEVESQLHAEIDAITAFIETHGLPAKKKAVEKVRKQLAGVSALVDLWWQRVWQDVQQVALTPMWQRWVDEQLLPLMYWQHQVSRTRCPRRKAKLLQALEAVQDTFA